jgi:hypothetical protein
MNGITVPSLENARVISKVIGVPLDELFPADRLKCGVSI